VYGSFEPISGCLLAIRSYQDAIEQFYTKDWQVGIAGQEAKADDVAGLKCGC
jgi:hypothetical protein